MTLTKECDILWAEARIRNLKHEEMFVFDKDDKLIAAYKGGPTSVSFPSTLLQQEGITVTHGHPKSMANFGGTFSFADMKNMLNSKWAEHRATASGQGEMNYILRKTSSSNAKGFYNQINRDYQRLVKEYTAKYISVRKTALANGATKAAAEHRARQEAVGTLNAYYKQTASKYGYSYVTRKTEYQYNR